MKIIVVVDKYWGIGKNNDLLFSLKKDMQFFKEKTINKVIVMGSNTLLSFPNARPLPKRTNIVLYPGGHRDDCIVVQTLDELFAHLKQYNANDVFIVGGTMFYKTMLPYCDTAYITKVNADGQATHFFENLDDKKEWQCVEESDLIVDSGLEIKFTVYRNNQVKKY